MSLFKRLKIRGKLIASFGLAMVIVISALGTVTYLTFADSVLTSQARISGLQAQLAQRVVDDAMTVVDLDLESRDCGSVAQACPPGLHAASPALAHEIMRLDLPEAVSLLLSSPDGQWLILKSGTLDAGGLMQGFARLRAEAAAAALDPAQVPALASYPDTATNAAAAAEPVPVHDASRYLLTRPLARPGYQLHYAVPEALYQADLMALKNRVIAATVVVLWASVWIVLIIAQRLALPVRNLSEVMSMAEQRIENTPARLLARGDEIGELARAFDALAARVRSLIHVDPLTQLYNRRYAAQTLERHLVDALKHQRSLVCLIMDVDFFKAVNDNFGHPCGDQALIHCAQVIRGGLRPDDVLARHGGEEFLVVLPNLDLAQGLARADAFRRRLEQSPLHWDGHTLQLTISVGVGWITELVREAASHSGGGAMAQMIEEADQALYEAKRRGRNRVVVRQPATGQYEVLSTPEREAKPVSALALDGAGRDADQRVQRAEA